MCSIVKRSLILTYIKLFYFTNSLFFRNGVLYFGRGEEEEKKPTVSKSYRNLSTCFRSFIAFLYVFY